MLSNRSHVADLVVDGTVELCRELPSGRAQASSGESVAVGEACEVLARWDHTLAPESRGALLFRSYRLLATEAAAGEGVSLWMEPFDAEQPVTTPNTLDTSAPVVARALADAVLELSTAGIAVTLLAYSQSDDPGSPHHTHVRTRRFVAFDVSACAERVRYGLVGQYAVTKKCASAMRSDRLRRSCRKRSD
jgi:acyl-homoserine lactone acylase PvdQ